MRNPAPAPTPSPSPAPASSSSSSSSHAAEEPSHVPMDTTPEPPKSTQTQPSSIHVDPPILPSSSEGKDSYFEEQKKHPFENEVKGDARGFAPGQFIYNADHVQKDTTKPRHGKIIPKGETNLKKIREDKRESLLQKKITRIENKLNELRKTKPFSSMTEGDEIPLPSLAKSKSKKAGPFTQEEKPSDNRFVEELRQSGIKTATEINGFKKRMHQGSPQPGPFTSVYSDEELKDYSHGMFPKEDAPNVQEEISRINQIEAVFNFLNEPTINENAPISDFMKSKNKKELYQILEQAGIMKSALQSVSKITDLKRLMRLAVDNLKRQAV